MDPSTGEVRTIPLELMVEGDKEPVYHDTLEVRGMGGVIWVVGSWVCGVVGMIGFVGLWVCGFVGLWVCGFVGSLIRCLVGHGELEWNRSVLGTVCVCFSTFVGRVGSRTSWLLRVSNRTSAFGGASTSQGGDAGIFPFVFRITEFRCIPKLVF